MSSKSQLWQYGSCESQLITPIRPSWGTSPATFQDNKLVSPWTGYDAKVRPGLARHIRWNTVLGIGFATVVSASMWAGIVLAVGHILR